MVHILAKHLRSEFLAVPELVRFDMAVGKEGPEPPLLIKATSLSLKYLIKRKAFHFIIASVGKKIAYGVEIPDDPEAPATAWSLVGLEAELMALYTLMQNPRCVVFLFNELAVSVAWTEIRLEVDPSIGSLLQSAKLHPPQQKPNAKAVGVRFDAVRVSPTLNSQIIGLEDIHWHELKATYLRNQMGQSTISLFHPDEGGQQEEIAVWLTDNLDPTGCAKGPFIETSPRRELSDVVLTHEYGTILIESKSLAIFGRDTIPDRKKLASDLLKHVRKATRQLTGAIRALKSGVAVTNELGLAMDLERTKPVHAIIMVPDLSLLEDATDLGVDFILSFMEETGGFLHILDPAELLRVVQAAEAHSDRSQILTRMMTFDLYLMERAKAVRANPTPYSTVLFELQPREDR